jgi:hypothetical protein
VLEQHDPRVEEGQLRLELTLPVHAAEWRPVWLQRPDPAAQREALQVLVRPASFLLAALGR